jgi:hypothetical protein
MKRMRPFLFVFALAALLPLVVDASIQQIRAQVPITITLVVTNPLGLAAPPAASPGLGISLRTTLNKSESSTARFNAENLSFVGPDAAGPAIGPDVIAQAVKQGAVQVRASISPNPTGTLLYGGCTAQPVGCNGVTIPVTAGVVTTVSCAYTISVDTTLTNWSLDHGLFTDFENALTGKVAFSGKLLSNNSHLATPHPVFTPFIVYSDGTNWALLQANGGMKSYCVDLQITVPTSVLSGTYSSNATYSLYY